MQNRDKLEEYIRREVNQIEFDGADAMWQEFQVQLANEGSGSGGKWGLWIGFLSLITLLASGGLVWGIFFSSQPTAEIQKEDRISAEKEWSSSISSYSDWTEGASPQRNQEMHHGSIAQGEAETTDQAQKPRGINLSTTKLPEQASAALKPENSARQEKQEGNDPNPNQEVPASFRSSVIASPPIQEASQQESFAQRLFAENAVLTPSGEDYQELNLMPMPETEYFWLHNFASPIPTALLASAQETPKAKRYYISFENSLGRNGIRQHGLGLGRYFSLNEHVGLSVQLGGSLNTGYSFSQDSLTIIKGLSIVENRKDKDLIYLGNAYLNLGTFYRQNKWRLGLGIRSSYALVNQFYFVERTRVTHAEKFNTHKGEIFEREERGNWSGINRWGFDGYINANHQIGVNYSMGLFLEKRLNPLIQPGMARKAYSNTPVEFGILMNYHF